ncbi:coiled-coil domain-containing protein 180 isoform 2-T4 [Spinachia spinachia]
MAEHRDKRTTCLPAEDSKTPCSTTSRWLCPLTSRRQHDEDKDDVCRLPDSMVVDHQNYFLLKQLTEEKRKKHNKVLKEMKTELTHLNQVCDSQVTIVVEELLASLKDLDLKVNPLMVLLNKQEVRVLWEEMQDKVKMKKTRIMGLNHKLTECETQRFSKVRVLLIKNVHLLENIGFLLPPDIFRLIDTEATMMNLSLLMNRRCAARLMLLLLEENLQQEEQLHLQWEELLSCWRRSMATGVLDRFRSRCSNDEEQRLVSGQLVERREEMIHLICSLVPPSCSTTLASDWFKQLTVINQQIDDLHSKGLHQLCCRSHHRWSDHLAEAKLCEKELAALQLSEVEINDVMGSELLAVIGRGQSRDEQRLAAVDRCCDAVARRALHLSRCVFFVMRGAVLLWETHSQKLERRREEVEQHMDKLQRTQQQQTQREQMHLDSLLCALRQVSSEEALKKSLDETISYLDDVRNSRVCVSDQVEVLDRLPFLLLEELLSYSSSLCSFFHLDHTYRLSPEVLQNLHPNLHSSSQFEAQIKEQAKKMEARGPAHLSPDWLTEAGSSLQALSDMSSDVTFSSYRGVVYTGPAFRCTAPELVDHLQLEKQLSLFPLELLTHTLSRTRTLFLDHLEQHVQDVLSSVITTVTERKEAAYWDRELQLKQLKIQHTQKQMYTPRLAELQLHTRLVKSHCEEVSNVLTSLRVEHQEHQVLLSVRKQELILNLSHVEAGAEKANSTTRLHALISTLKGCLDQHIKDTQHLQTTFRQNVIVQLHRVRTRTTRLLSPFRLFTEGGDFAPEELNYFQKKLKEETRRIRVTEESILSELEEVESDSLKQLKKTSKALEEKLCSMRSEMDFIEQIQHTMRKTRVQIKAETASSKQQQIIIRSKLEDLRKMMESTQVSPDQVCSLLSTVNEEFRKRCRYLDFPLVSSLSALHESGERVQSSPPPGLLQIRRTGVELLQDPVVEVIRSLNRFCEIQNAAAAERDEGGVSPAGHHLHTCHSLVQQKCTKPLRLRRGGKSIRTERRFQVFGPEPEQNPHSFSSSLNSLLWRTNDALLLVAEDFYRREHSVCSRFFWVPDSLDQWAESMQQRLLGYQDQMRKFLCTSREELETQLSLLENRLLSLPAVLICNHEQRQEAELIEEVSKVRGKFEEKLAVSEEEKSMNVNWLRVSLGDEELLTLSAREELRQQQLHSDICSLHLELQLCVKVREEGFVTSLGLLTETLCSQLDELLLPEVALQHSAVDTVTVATEVETGRKQCTISRTWSGDPIPTDPPPGVTMATTTSVTTTRCTLGHTVIEQRDAAEKRLQQVLRLELSRSDEDKRRTLSGLQSWSAHWRQQIHTLKSTHTP